MKKITLTVPQQTQLKARITLKNQYDATVSLIKDAINSYINACAKELEIPEPEEWDFNFQEMAFVNKIKAAPEESNDGNNG